MMIGIETLAARLSSRELAVSRLVDGTGVILDVNGLKVYSLNETGMFLVDQLQRGVVDKEVLVDALVDSFDVDRETATGDLDTFLANLARRLG